MTIQIMEASDFEANQLTRDLLRELKAVPGLTFGNYIKMNTNIKFSYINSMFLMFNKVLRNLHKQGVNKIFINLG